MCPPTLTPPLSLPGGRGGRTSLSPARGRGQGEGARWTCSLADGPASAASPALRDGDRRGLRRREAVVARPRERERAALGGDGRERDERVRGDGGVQLGAEDLDAVVRAHELADEVARDRGAPLRAAIAGLHDVGDQRLDLD